MEAGNVFTSKSPGVTGTHFIYLRRMKGQYILLYFYKAFRTLSLPEILPDFLIRLYMLPWLGNFQIYGPIQKV